MLLFCVVFMLTVISLPQSHNSHLISNTSSLETLNNFKIRTSANSKIIIINNNYELNQTATSGYGTLINPYIIEDLTINGNGSLYCILINNTDKYFILKDCILFNSTYGILINNVTNSQIFVSFMYSNINAGIFLKDSNNITITGNSVYANNDYGIKIENTNHSNIIENSLWDNVFAGIYLDNSITNNITKNAIDRHKYPIFLQSSNYSYIINNTGNGNTYGIKELNCVDNYFEGNIFINEFRDDNFIDTNKNDKNIIIIDFTLIIFLCLIISIIGMVIVRKPQKFNLNIFKKKEVG